MLPNQHQTVNRLPKRLRAVLRGLFAFRHPGKSIDYRMVREGRSIRRLQDYHALEMRSLDPLYELLNDRRQNLNSGGRQSPQSHDCGFAAGANFAPDTIASKAGRTCVRSACRVVNVSTPTVRPTRA